jgi:hypothetical protein
VDARQFLDERGREETRQVAEAAGTNLAYFEQIACGARRPSLELADRLTAASRGAMDVMSLLRSREIAAERRASKSGTPAAA